MVRLQLLPKQEECFSKAGNQSALWRPLDPWGCTMRGHSCLIDCSLAENGSGYRYFPVFSAQSLLIVATTKKNLPGLALPLCVCAVIPFKEYE